MANNFKNKLIFLCLRELSAIESYPKPTILCNFLFIKYNIILLHFSSV